MDFALRCNSLECRTHLKEDAVVTTCSHIFCVPCSQSLGLSSPQGHTRTCPACQTQLSNPDDAVLTQLDPSEDYKTSVLSGLSPSIIMECAGRGLAFYSYQATQEIVYQEYLAKSLTDKYSGLSGQMDKIIHEANTEITSLRDQLSAMHIDQKNLAQKNHELVEKYREKAKNHQQLEKLYNSLKQQQLASGIELAAEHDAENVIMNAGGIPLNNNARPHEHVMHSRAGSRGSGSSGRRRQHAQHWESQVLSNVAAQRNSRKPLTKGLKQSTDLARILPLSTQRHQATALAFQALCTAIVRPVALAKRIVKELRNALLSRPSIRIFTAIEATVA